MKPLLKDFFVVGSCVLVFAATVTLTAEKDHRHTQAGPKPPGKPPIAQMAHDLDVPADRLRNAFEKIGPPSRTPFEPPSEQQLGQHSEKLANELNVPTDRLRSLMAAYMPPPGQ